MIKSVFTFLLVTVFAFTLSVQGQNLVTNGDLETWSTDVLPDGWDKAESITKESTTIHGGTYAAKHTSGDGTLDFQQDVEGITGGATYTIEYFYFDNDPAARTRIWSYWMDADGTYLDDHADILRPGTYSEDNAAWQSFNQVLVAPLAATQFRFEVRVYKQDGISGGAVYYDDFSITTDATVDPEPTNYPTAFAAAAEDLGIRLSWTDATGAQVPDAYLILGEAVVTRQTNFDLPVDGQPMANNDDPTQGTLVWNVLAGAETFLFSNLEANTMYHFAIFPYTNAGTDIDYKTDGSYPEATATTQNVVVLLNEPFDADLGVMNAYSVLGDQVWVWSSFGSDQFAKMSGYSGGALDNEDWLISPELNLSGLQSATLTFRSAYNYDGDPLQLLVSNDYDGQGNPNDFAWTNITDNAQWSDGSFNFVESGNVDVFSYADPKLFVAFKYTSNTTAASNWEIDYVRVTGEGTVGFAENNVEKVVVYPNPATSAIQFNVIDKLNATITDLQGRVVFNQQLEAGEASIDVSGFTKGVYVITLRQDNGSVQTSRFSKM